MLRRPVEVARLPGITINEGIKRRSHLEVDLPFFKNSLDHINESVAKGKVVDQGEDRLWVFTLKGQDVVRSRNSMSRLSIGMTIGRNVGLRTFTEEAYSYDYAFRFARRDARREHLEDRLAVLTEEYLPEKFGGGDRRSLSTYLTALDKALDSAGVAGDDNFGSTLVGLEVSVSGKALAAWKKVSGDKLDPRYLEISRRVQTMLREYIRRCYLQDLDNYRQTVAVCPLFVYSALPPINRAKLKGKTLEFNESDIYNWDYRSAKVLARMLEEHCQPRLPKMLRQAYRDLEGSSLIEDYRYANIGKMLRLKPKQAKENFQTLVLTEAYLIKAIHSACLRMHKFLAADKLDEATEELAKTGAELTEAFNNKVGNTIYEGAGMRPLGTLLFLEVARALDSKLAKKIRPVAMMELGTLLFLEVARALDSKLGIRVASIVRDVEVDDFLLDKRPESSEIALSQRFVG